MYAAALLLLLADAGQVEARNDVIDRIAELIVERYVYEDVSKRCAARLRDRHAAGEFRAAGDADFAAAVTTVLRRDCDDEHMELIVASGEAPTRGPDDWMERLRRRNYDFAELRHLEGNVGYLDLRSFPPPDLAATTAAGAMSFLSATDAIIIDLRNNEGGANAGRYTDVPPRFRLFVPNAHAISAATGATWDKTGISPDIASAADNALAVAHRTAVLRLTRQDA